MNMIIENSELFLARLRSKYSELYAAVALELESLTSALLKVSLKENTLVISLANSYMKSVENSLSEIKTKLDRLRKMTPSSIRFVKEDYDFYVVEVDRIHLNIN